MRTFSVMGNMHRETAKQTFPPPLGEMERPKPITEFRFPADFEAACSKEGAKFMLMRRKEKGEQFEESDRVCLIKIRRLERPPDETKEELGIDRVEYVSANMWIDGVKGCRMDRVLKYHSDGTVHGTMIYATADMDNGDPQIVDMDKTRYDEEGQISDNGFWSNPDLSYHDIKGTGTIKGMGRSLLAVLDMYEQERGQAHYEAKLDDYFKKLKQRYSLY